MKILTNGDLVLDGISLAGLTEKLENIFELGLPIEIIRFDRNNGTKETTPIANAQSFLDYVAMDYEADICVNFPITMKDSGLTAKGIFYGQSNCALTALDKAIDYLNDYISSCKASNAATFNTPKTTLKPCADSGTVLKLQPAA